MQKKVVFSQAEVRVPTQGLARIVGNLHKQGHFLRDATGNPAFCARCGAVIFSTEAYTTAKAGDGPALYSCERCGGAVEGGQKR